MTNDDDLNLSRRRFVQASAASLVVAHAGVGHARPMPDDAHASATGAATMTAARYVLARLSTHGASLLFGVPGATCDPLFAAAAATGHEIVVTSTDLEAGTAADGYARVRGLGAVAVTYGVGTMSLLQVIGGAYAERSPVVVVNGGPSDVDLKLQREYGTGFSHSIGRDQTDLDVFRHVTAYAARADKAADVTRVVDTAVRTALVEQRPVYIEIPKHLWDAKVAAPVAPLVTAQTASGRERALAESIGNALRAAKRPAVLVGIEVQRYREADAVTALLDTLGVPWASTLLSKSVIAETTPGFCGVYGGARALPAVKEIIERSDALLTIGCVWGRQHRDLVTKNIGAMVQVQRDGVRLGRDAPVPSAMAPLLTALLSTLQAQPWRKDPARLAGKALTSLTFSARRASVKSKQAASAEPGVGYDALMKEVSDALDESFVVLTDTSLSMIPAAELEVRGTDAFVCNAVWQAIGFSVAAAVGVGIAQARRPLVICGDGGFQMTAQSLSTMAKHNLRAIVVVLDNGTYGIEQWLLEPAYFADVTRAPKPYLALHRWRYAELARALGFAFAKTVSSAAELKTALAEAKAHGGPAFISASIPPHDLPAQLRAT